MQLSYIFKKRARKIRGVYVYGLYTIYSSWCWIGSDLGLQEHAVRMVRAVGKTRKQGRSHVGLPWCPCTRVNFFYH